MELVIGVVGFIVVIYTPIIYKINRRLSKIEDKIRLLESKSEKENEA
ncbi:hypothetical protein [Longirhabdus pacifica]|nr:hypothetical protein [Longirhabdus pacifica]